MTRFDPKKYPNVAEGHQYALDVVSGKIPNCKYIIGACQRYLDDLEKDVFVFKPKKAERYLRLVQKFKHVKGHWDSDTIVYEPWQKFFKMNVFGWFNKETGFRRFRIVHAEISRGQGKSLLASQAALYVLALDNPKGNEISCVATKTDQARIVLDSSRSMARKATGYLRNTGVEVLAHKIVHEESDSFIRALSSDSKSLDGLNDVLSIIDELHAVDEELFDVIVSGHSKRKDSLILCITTAGFDVEGVGYSQSNYAKKVAIGEVKDETFFALPYTIDEDDDIYDPVSWRKANPNWGVSVDITSFEQKALKTKEVPRDLPNFKVKHLNMWLSEAHAYFSVNKWDKLADESLSWDDFKGKRCYVGIDLASKVDLTSLFYIFKDDEGKYYFWDKSYIPEEAVKNDPTSMYLNSVGEGYLIQTPGEAINYDELESDFEKDSKHVRVIAAHYDPWAATQFAQRCNKLKIDMVEFRMTVANLSEPMKQLEVLIREGKIVHNGSPLLRWCLSNVVAKEDNKENVFPRKSNKRQKIDPIVACLMALAGWIQEEGSESVYKKRGIRFI